MSAQRGDSLNLNVCYHDEIPTISGEKNFDIIKGKLERQYPNIQAMINGIVDPTTPKWVQEEFISSRFTHLNRILLLMTSIKDFPMPMGKTRILHTEM